MVYNDGSFTTLISHISCGKIHSFERVSKIKLQLNIFGFVSHIASHVSDERAHQTGWEMRTPRYKASLGGEVHRERPQASGSGVNHTLSMMKKWGNKHGHQVYHNIEYHIYLTEWIITSILKYRMKLLIHSWTSTVAYHPTLSWACNYLSIPGLKLNHFRKRVCGRLFAFSFLFISKRAKEIRFERKK